MTVIDKDEEIKHKLQSIAQEYLEASIWENGWVKGQKHFEMCEPLCEYLTGKQYEKQYHSGLRLKIHEITDQVTTGLDISIGMPVPRGYQRPDIRKEDIPRYAVKLAAALVELIKRQNKEELLKYVRGE